MLEHSRETAAGPGRRWTFRIWIGITIVVAVYVAVVLAFVRDSASAISCSGSRCRS